MIYATKHHRESGHSLLQSKGLYLANPYNDPGKIEKTYDSNDTSAASMSYHKTLHENNELWQSFEDKVGTYLILENIK